MGGFSSPNFSLFISQSWAPGGDSGYPWPYMTTNVVTGTNPPYTPTDFLSFYPKFGGTPLVITGSVSQGATTITNLAGTGGLAAGQLIAGQQLPSGTYITEVIDPTQSINISQAATADGAQFTVFNQPFVPMYVLALYVNLASASLVQNRWQSSWPIGMALFIAHFCTLYLQSDGDAYGTPGQAATAGLARGIAVSKSAGGVSISYSPTTAGIDTWAAWNQTQYGQQFATLAAAIGAGPLWIY